MEQTSVTMNEVRETINHLVQGVDPFTGEILDNVSFLQNPKMIRCFAVMSDLSTMVIEKQERKEKQNRIDFSLTSEGVSKIIVPKEDCGAKKMAAAINQVIDINRMKALTAYNINKKLIDEGILSLGDVEGKKATVTNPKSESFGFCSVHVDRGERSYDKVVYKAEGKAYIMDHLLTWFGQ